MCPDEIDITDIDEVNIHAEVTELVVTLSDEQNVAMTSIDNIKELDVRAEVTELAVTLTDDTDIVVILNNVGIPGPMDPGLPNHIISEFPHPVYDDGPSLFLLYENAKV